MTKQSWLDLFYLTYDSLDDLGEPGITPKMLSPIVTKVIEDFVLENYKKFEVTEKDIEDLGELVRYKTYSSFTSGFLPNSSSITLPNTQLTDPTDFSDVYWFTIYEDAISNVLDCSIKDNTTVYIRPLVTEIPHGELITALEDPFRKPYVKNNQGKVLRTRSESLTQSLLTDGNFNITSYTIGYIKKPAPQDLTTNLNDNFSELSDETQTQILQLSVDKVKLITGNYDAVKANLETELKD